MKEEQELKEIQSFAIDLTLGKSKKQLSEEFTKDQLRKDIHLLTEILCANIKDSSGYSQFVIEGSYREVLTEELLKRINKL